MSLTVYADFSCPDCYLAAHRVDVLRAAGIAVDWRAVELSPHLPVGGRRLSAAEQDALAQRFAELDEMLLPGEVLRQLGGRGAARLRVRRERRSWPDHLRGVAAHRDLASRVGRTRQPGTARRPHRRGDLERT
jgi:predicted DsbA family dithiol-disulfide isomerase